jgi:cytochrome c peroxidase
MLRASAHLPLVALLSLAACVGETPTGGLDTDITPVHAAGGKPDPTPSTKDPVIAAGEFVYFDAKLSRGGNQACASCHAGTWGFTGPDDGSIASIADAFFEGSIAGRHGDRKPPSSAYASYSPVLFYDAVEATWRGGNFWDGRARGGKGVTAIAEQGLGPFKSAPEHAFGPVCVLYQISIGAYAKAFEAGTTVRFANLNFDGAWKGYGWTGPENCTNTTDTSPEFDAVISGYPTIVPGHVTDAELAEFEKAYAQVGTVLAAFEHSPAVNRFSSRFDAPTRDGWTADEKAGEALFFGASGCMNCHASDAGPELFTDFSYYNIGVPRNPANPAGADWKDLGIGAVVDDPQFLGHFKSPTVRNVAKKVGSGGKSYMHNGVLTSLEQVVHFYNTRDLKACPKGITYGAGWKRFPTVKDPVSTAKNGICWPAPDFPATMTRDLLEGTPRGPLGNLKLSSTEERQLVAYMKTLSDGN